MLKMICHCNNKTNEKRYIINAFKKQEGEKALPLFFKKLMIKTCIFSRGEQKHCIKKFLFDYLQILSYPPIYIMTLSL